MKTISNRNRNRQKPYFTRQIITKKKKKKNIVEILDLKWFS